jgi:hypothetical protein
MIIAFQLRLPGAVPGSAEAVPFALPSNALTHTRRQSETGIGRTWKQVEHSKEEGRARLFHRTLSPLWEPRRAARA